MSFSGGSSKVGADMEDEIYSEKAYVIRTIGDKKEDRGACSAKLLKHKEHGGIRIKLVLGDLGTFGSSSEVLSSYIVEHEKFYSLNGGLQSREKPRGFSFESTVSSDN